MQPDLFKPAPAFIGQLQQKRALARQLIKSRTALINQQKAFKHLPDPDKQTLNSCKSMINKFTLEIKKIELQMEQLANLHCQQLFSQLKTIPGISTKAALELIIVSGMFRNLSA